MKKLMAAVATVATLAMAANADTVTTNGVTWIYTIEDSTANTVSLGTGVEPSAANLSAGNCIPMDTVIDASKIPWTFTKDGTDYTVVKIEKFAFYNCKGLTGTLALPDCITYLNTSAFNASGLTGISSLGSGYTINLGVQQNVFRDCTNLTGRLVIPDAFNTGFNNYVFYNTGFSAITVGSNTTQIGRYFASKCTNLKGVWIKGRSGSNYTAVKGYNTFASSTNLKVALFGLNTSYDDASNSYPTFQNITGCKVFIPANGKWTAATTAALGGTSTDAIYYGANTNLNVAVDESANTITSRRRTRLRS